MAFKPIKYDSGKTEEVGLVTSATVARHDALDEDGNGLYQRATSSTTGVNYVALEAATSAAAGTKILALRTRGVEFEADTNANPAATDVGTQADLTDHDTLDESTSSNNVFFIKSILGAAADKKVIGEFVQDVE